MFSIGHFPFNDLTEPAIPAETSETSLGESGKGHQVIRGVKDMLCLALLLCGTTNALQLKPLWATGQTIQSGEAQGWDLWVLMITAKEDGMSESLTSGDVCESETGMPSSRHG